MNKTTRNILIIVGIILILLCCCCAIIYAGYSWIIEEGDGFFEPVITQVFETIPPIEPGEESPLESPPVEEIGYGVYREAKCPFPGEFERITCGYLSVPEDRSNPEGRQIELAVAIVHSATGSSDTVPLVYLEGGPGGSGLDGADYLWLDSPLAADRDVILMDQRGTGYSNPTLNCVELDSSDLYTLEDEFDAMEDCRDRLLKMGIDLNMYNSAASAADVADLRIALGYEEVDLLGVSYGTRLALTVIRDHPTGIRAVILDSVYPPHVDVLTEQPQTTLNAFETLFDGCEADPACRRAYPDLEEIFYDLVIELNFNPAMITFYDYYYGEEYEQEYWGDDLIYDVFDSLYDTSLIPYLPAFIYAMYEAEYDLAFEILDIYYPYETYYYEDGDYVDVSDSEGMFYSVECREEVFFNDVDAAEDMVDDYDDDITLGLIWEVEDFFDTCEMWGTTPAGIFENKPVVSSIPTLLLNGEYDPVTPADWAHRAAEHLSNSQVFIFPGYGHAVIDAGPCPVEIMLEFLASPESPVEAACFSAIGPPDFVIDS